MLSHCLAWTTTPLPSSHRSRFLATPSLTRAVAAAVMMISINYRKIDLLTLFLQLRPSSCFFASSPSIPVPVNHWLLMSSSLPSTYQLTDNSDGKLTRNSCWSLYHPSNSHLYHEYTSPSTIPYRPSSTNFRNVTALSSKLNTIIINCQIGNRKMTT